MTNRNFHFFDDSGRSQTGGVLFLPNWRGQFFSNMRGSYYYHSEGSPSGGVCSCQYESVILLPIREILLIANSEGSRFWHNDRVIFSNSRSIFLQSEKVKLLPNRRGPNPDPSFLAIRSVPNPEGSCFSSTLKGPSLKF